MSCGRFLQSMERLLSHVVQLKNMLQRSIIEHDTVCSILYGYSQTANYCISFL